MNSLSAFTSIGHLASLVIRGGALMSLSITLFLCGACSSALNASCAFSVASAFLTGVVLLSSAISVTFSS